MRSYRQNPLHSEFKTRLGYMRPCLKIETAINMTNITEIKIPGSHLAKKLIISGSEQLNGFRKSLKLTRLTRTFPFQVFRRRKNLPTPPPQDILRQAELPRRGSDQTIPSARCRDLLSYLEEA